jgi:hypothetical protein
MVAHIVRATACLSNAAEVSGAAAFVNRGACFRDLTVGEFMAGTSLSRPAFCQYFASLHELIESLFGDLQVLLHHHADPWINGEGDPIAALRKSFGEIVQTCVEHGPILRAVAEAAPFDLPGDFRTV